MDQDVKIVNSLEGHAASEYKKHYSEFARSVNFAVRTWYHYVYLSQKVREDPVIFKALSKAPAFWSSYNYSATQTVIIFLGKIFDNDGNTYNIDKMRNATYNGLNHFSKSELRKRKVVSGGEFDGLDEYIQNASELDGKSIKVISEQVKQAKKLWESMKPLRDKIYAHNEVLSEGERNELYKAVKNSDVNNILQILLNISNALWNAEFNGHKPDFLFDYTDPINWAKKDIDELISSLIGT